MGIRIIAVPPGEAPEEIRRAWVGLVLPLAFGESTVVSAADGPADCPQAKTVRYEHVTASNPDAYVSSVGEVRQIVDGERHRVAVTPPPVLARFEGRHHGVAGAGVVRSRVPRRRRVAAADMATDPAHPQVNPPLSLPEAVLATLG